MKNLSKIIGIIAVAAVITFSMTACPEDNNGGGKAPEDLTEAERWATWVDPSSTATLDSFSVSNDGLVTITIGGVAEPDGQDNVWRAWTIQAHYSYTAVQANASYTYVFEAWTKSGSRTLNVVPCWDEDGVSSDERVTLTTTKTVFTITAERIPNSGVRALDFHCAGGIGTFYVKIISIAVAEPKTLAIGGIRELVNEFSYNTDGMIALFSAGTTVNEALNAANNYNQTGDSGIIVAVARLSDADLSNNNTTAYYRLYNPRNGELWTGSGSYMIGMAVESYNSQRAFWTGPVNFSSATTYITYKSDWEINLP